MKKNFLIKNPELFQGKKYLKLNKNYFEGWYFKNTNSKEGISFIPGISISDKNKYAFIQIITSNSSYFVNYTIDEFLFCDDPFYVKIGNNIFSKDGIHIDIEDKVQDIRFFGDIKYSSSIDINTSFFSPNIMGPFSYISFMECNHAILSMKSRIDGFINFNNNKISFNDDIGYIEKDWGCSFPKNYIWCQGNNFKNKKASFMLSIADIPFLFFNFRGVICLLIIDDKEFNFSTYCNVKINKYNIDKNSVDITLKKGRYSLNIKSKYVDEFRLVAPVKGNMNKDILESISTSIIVTLKDKDNIIFSDTSMNCGLEIVDK